VIEMTHASGPVYNIVAPKPAAWNTIFGAFAERLNVPMIPYDIWLQRVIAAAEINTNEEDVQALSLTDFFRKYESDRGISTSYAVKAATTLANAEALNAEDARRYLSYWESIGYIKL
jgi:hypothetical protein